MKAGATSVLVVTLLAFAGPVAAKEKPLGSKSQQTSVRDKLGEIGTIAGPLNPGDSVTLTKTTTLQNIAGLLTNVGTVVGSDHFGHTVTAHDDAVVTIVLAERITLPRTGWDLVPPTGLGLGLFIVGSVLLWIPRRRRPA